MDGQNGNTPVTRYELHLQLDPLRADVAEIKDTLAGAAPKPMQRKDWLVVGGLFTSGAGVVVAIIAVITT